MAAAVAERDRSGFVQQQHVHVAGGLYRAPGHGKHISLDQPVHSRDANGGKQAADRRRNQADEQRQQGKRCAAARR